MNQQARALRTYDLIVDAAADEFTKQGFGPANLQRVADRTGLTKGALYGHFTSKRALADALVEHLEKVVAVVLADLGQPRDGAPARLRDLTAALAERVETDPRVRAGLRLVMEEGWSAGKAPPVLEDVRRAALELAARAGQPAHSADLAMVLLLGVCLTSAWQDGTRPLGRLYDDVRLLVPVLSDQEE